MTGFYQQLLDRPVRTEASGGVIAIGNFDGVHVGHQIVLERAMEIARTCGTKCFALSFEPHPRTLFKPDSPVFRLTDASMKATVLDAMGLDGLLVLEFTRNLAATSADDFVTTFLLARARASHVVSGFNFHFGKNRAGTPEFLRQSGVKQGFGVTIIDAVTDGGVHDGQPVSSSRIRRMLGAGEVKSAARLLNYHWLVSGKVIEGAKLGRTLNFPTANIVLPASCHLAHGIYAVHLRRANGEVHQGVANFGRRPTFDNGPVLLETFIFDFSGDLYGEVISVSLIEYLRPEERFSSADELVAQMHKDTVYAKQVLSDVEPLSDLDRRLNFIVPGGEHG